MVVVESDRRGLRVAIVGFGPKGLFALERLLDRAHRLGPEACLEIDLFEPHPVPGAGPVYDPDQPGYLRLNCAADRLDLWWPHSRAVPTEEQLSFVAWRLADSGHVLDGAQYPARAQVGSYLADGFARMLRHAAPGISIAVRATAISTLRQRDTAWEAVTQDGARHEYDEVLLAVGHGVSGGGRSSPAAEWEHAAPLIPTVFPVTRWLATDAVAPGANVAVRGFALTFLDAALALTEGRGGSFERGPRPYTLRYRPTLDDVGSVMPFSRSGRPMLPKPEPQLAASIPALKPIATSGCADLLALAHGCAVEDVVAILARTAAASLLAANGRGRGGDPLHRASQTAEGWLLAAARGTLPPLEHDPATEIERALAVGAGQRRPGLQWALGQSWRSLYPALVTKLGASGLAGSSWPAFRRLAAETERISFGPPPLNAAKLLALITAGRVDLAHVHGGQLITTNGVTVIRSGHGECRLDAVVNAVLPEPGAVGSCHGLPAQLVADGHARVLPGRRGVEVTDDAGCIGANGRRTPRLSIIGRPTEDSVIGNDTLSRTLHPQVDRWAQRVVERSRRDANASRTDPNVALPRAAA